MKTNIYTLPACKCACKYVCSVSGDRLSVMRIRTHIHINICTSIVIGARSDYILLI